MKKFAYSFLFALILPLLIFTGCGGSAPKKFTITFFVDNEVWSTMEAEDQNPITLPFAPDKENYFFKGWELRNNGSMTFNPGDTYIASSNQSLYALYAPIALQLTHNEMPGVVVSRFGTNYNVDLPENMEVVNLKEIFNYSDEATWEITGSSDIVIDGHIVTLHSAWGNITLIGTYQGETITYFINLNNPYILTRYTLTFEGVANPVYVKEGQTIAPTDIPDLPECYDEDYIAASWDFDFSTPIYSDQYINYTIDQKYKHVKYYVDGELVYTSEELTYGDPTTPIDRTAFTKDHYYTELWNTKPDFTGANVAYDFNFDAEYQALYLEFRPIEYSVYFNNSAGSTKLDGTPPPTLYYTIESSTSELTLPELMKDYYNFVGYEDADGNLYEIFPIEKIGQITELNVIWDPIKFNITYNLNGGTNSDQNPEYLVADKLYYLADPSRSHYIFDGWYTAPEYDNASLINNIETSIPKEMTLYAKWQIINYHVDYYYVHYLENENELIKTINIENNIVVSSRQTGHTFNNYADINGEDITTVKNGTIYINPEYMEKAQWSTSINQYTIHLFIDSTPIQYPINYISSKPIGNNPNPTTYTIMNKTTFNAPTSNGYDFVNFTDGSSEITEIPKGETGAKTVYLNWDIIEYNLSFVNLTPEVYFMLDHSYEKYTVESDFEFVDIEFSIIEKGYTFNAFYADEAKTQPITGITPGCTGEKTIYIAFEVAVYTITYQNTQGGMLYRNNQWITGDLTTTYTYFDEEKTSLGFMYREFFESQYKITYEGMTENQELNRYNAGYPINDLAADLTVEPIYTSIFSTEDGVITDVSISTIYGQAYATLPKQASITLPTKINGETIVGVDGTLDKIFNTSKLIFPEGYTSLKGELKTSANEIVLPSTLTSLYKHFIQKTYCPNLTTCDVSHTQLTEWDNALPNTVTTIVLPATLISFTDKTIRDYTFPENLQSLIFGSDSSATMVEMLDITHIIDLAILNLNNRFAHVKISPEAVISLTQGCANSTVEVVSADTKSYSSTIISAKKVIIGNNINIEISRQSLTSLIVGDNCDITIAGNYYSANQIITNMSFGQNSKIAGFDSMSPIDLTTLPTTKIVISGEITSLSNYAFANVKNFSSIFEFEDFDAITSIGAYAFYNSTGVPSDFSSLTGLTTLNANTFQNTTFIDGADAELILPEGITSIGRYALSNLNIKKLYIPSSVETIGDYALSGSTFGELFAPFMKKDQVGHFYNATIKRFTLLEGETTMYESTDLYTYKFNDGLEYVCLPSTLTEIPDGIFSRQTSLTEVVITDTSSNPSKLTTIGSQAFEYCSALQSIVLPNSVKVISSSAFNGCSSLSQVNMPAALETISSYAFMDCALTEVIIPTSATTIGLGAFNNCPITFAYLPTTITNINGAIFMGAPNNIVIATDGSSIPSNWNKSFCKISDSLSITPTYNYDITQR